MPQSLGSLTYSTYSHKKNVIDLKLHQNRAQKLKIHSTVDDTRANRNLYASPVKIGRASNTHEAVGIGQFQEHVNLIVTLEQHAHGHGERMNL